MVADALFTVIPFKDMRTEVIYLPVLAKSLSVPYCVNCLERKPLPLPLPCKLSPRRPPHTQILNDHSTTNAQQH